MNLTQHFPLASSEISDFRNGSLRIIHITDTHLLDSPNDVFHAINTRHNFQRVLSHCMSHHPEVDFVLITGDISQTGNISSYRVFDSVINNFDVPVYCVPGNHDIPEFLARFVPTSPAKHMSVVALRGINLLLLNSCVDGKHAGKVSDESLHQLQTHLEGCGQEFNILAIHHPPVLINSRWLDELGLENRNDLLQIITRFPRDILLLSGHVHQEVDQQMDNLRLLATPSTCHQFKSDSDDMCHLEAPMPAYRYIDVDQTGRVTTSVHYLS